MLRTPESGEVSAAVRGWLTGQGYGAVTDGAPPERRGRLLGVRAAIRRAGPAAAVVAPLVARVPAAAGRYDMLRQDSAVQSWAAARGYPAPEIKWLRLARRLTEAGGAGHLAASLRKIELVRDRLEVADPVVCHGDFHPGNVLVAPGGSALHVIDWTTSASATGTATSRGHCCGSRSRRSRRRGGRPGCSCGCCGAGCSGLT